MRHRRRSWSVPEAGTRCGRITKESQLRDAAQKGAASVEGFHETHMGVLEAAAVSARLNELLARAAAP